MDDKINKSDKKKDIEEKKVSVPRTLADIQRFKLEKLLKNPVSFVILSMQYCTRERTSHSVKGTTSV